MARPKRYPDTETYRKEYNSRPEVKERNKIHNIKWRHKPDVQEKLKKYNREYMKNYWKANPDKYKLQKLKIAQLNRERNNLRKTG